MQTTDTGNKRIYFDGQTDRETFLKSKEIGYLAICCIEKNITQLMKSRNKELKFSFNSISFNSSWVRLISVLDFFRQKII